MLNEKQIKPKLQELIDDFKRNYEQYKKELEANTETKLVEPLFELLGWTKKDFVKQEKARRETRMGHADYAFYIGDKIAFFLEVKKVGVPLEKEADKQVISYALSKRVSFAVSTNFEELKIFCVEQEDALRNKFRVFNSPDEYLTNFDDLLFLSKESFEQGLTLKKAESEGRLKRRVSIDRSLLEDLMHIRSLIASDIEKSYSGKYQINEKDEIIQRIIDRLIFVRRCEDTGINPENVTLKEVQHLADDKAYPLLKEIFERYNDVYNSGLFVIAKDNDCDKITIDGSIIKKLTQYLYESKDGEYIYNFDWIDADVLGQVYEQYLGKLLAQTKSGKARLTNGQAHRKEQGIYYTPTYIVDYIVKNTVGELLKNEKIKVKDIKILDPACGSGSFLIKAFDYLYDTLLEDKESTQYRIDNQGKYSIKTEILKNNIYGVDLDQKAVEITKLNLLLKAAEKNRLLPEEIDVHIKHGNSLINDETIAGLNAFKWGEKFKEIMDKGGFDVIVGNPPYVRQEELSEIKPYFQKNYEVYHGMADLFVYFFEREIGILKDGGYFGMIVSNKWLRAGYGINLRRFISKFWIETFIDFGDLKVFPDATIYPCIIILKKINKQNSKINVCKMDTLNFNSLEEHIKNRQFTINQKELGEKEWNVQSIDSVKIINKIISKGIPLTKYVGEINYGIKTGFNEAFIVDKEKRDELVKENKRNSEIIKPYLTGAEIKRYSIKPKNQYIILTKIGTNLEVYPEIKNLMMNYKTQLEKRWDKGNYWYELRACAYYDLFEKPKIVWGNLSTKASFAYDENSNYVNAPACILPTSSKYVLGILNSKLMSYFLKSTCAERQGGFIEQKPVYVSKIPIKKPSSSEEEMITKFVDKILLLNKRLNEIGDKKTSVSSKLEEEIQKIDNEIDQLVYKLYGLTQEEIAIVEDAGG